MILAAGLSPAWQRILVFEGVTPGAVNRAREVYECASGKVLNVGLALTTLGSKAVTVSVVGGPAGERIQAEFAQLGVDARWVFDAAATRTCTTLIEPGGRITELVENAQPISADSWSRFQSTFAATAREADWVVLCGSLPVIAGRASTATVYAELMENCPGRVLLDARGPELLQGLERKPFLVKPNREELAATVGHALPDEPALLAAMRELNHRGAEWVLVTDGPGVVWLSSRQEHWQFTPAAIDVVNPIGCGDCLAAGLAAGLDEGLPCPEAVAFGIAAAADNARSMLPARLDRNRVATGVEHVQQFRAN